MNGLVYAAEGLGRLVGKGVAKAVPSVRIVQACYCVTYYQLTDSPRRVRRAETVVAMRPSSQRWVLAVRPCAAWVRVCVWCGVAP